MHQDPFCNELRFHEDHSSLNYFYVKTYVHKNLDLQKGFSF